MFRGKLSVFLCVFMLVTLLAMTAAHGSQEPLKRGAKGEEVLKVQYLLQQYGYYEGELDGLFGAGTLRALVYFQGDCGLNVDGVVGAQTWAALDIFTPGAVVKTDRGADFNRMGSSVVEFARQFVGTPYSWAGSSPGGFDCSGFVVYVLGEFGVGLPHRADLQFNQGYIVYDLLPGDLVFYTTYESGPSHVGIYMGDGNFIHASSGAGYVTITAMSTSYYSARYLGARRVLD